MFSQLHDRTLWFDGISSYSSNQIVEAIFNDPTILDHCFITTKDKLFEQYEAESYEKLNVKEKLEHIDNHLISSVSTLFDIVEYINDKFISSLPEGVSEEELIKRYDRIEYEVMCFIKIEKINYLYTIIHIVEQMVKNKICWNSRGSSSASYLLYVLGVHFIDSYRYNLDPKEFFKVEL